MDRSVFKLRVCYLAAAFLTLLCTVLRSVSLLTAFDADPGYYTRGALLPIFLRGLIIATVLFALLFPLYIKKEELPAGPTVKNRACVFSGALNCLCLLLLLIEVIRYNTTLGLVSSFLYFLLVFSLIASLLYYLIPFFGEKAEILSVPTGCFLLLALALLSVYLYFDRYTPVNAPQKIGIQAALLASMLSLLYSLRGAAGIGMPRAFAASTAATFFFSASVGISDLIAFLAGRFDDRLYLVFDLFLIAVAIRSAVGLIDHTAEVAAKPRK